jgi:RNA polymerase sigma-70 factor (ECF subfamily)
MWGNEIEVRGDEVQVPRAQRTRATTRRPRPEPESAVAAEARAVRESFEAEALVHMGVLYNAAVYMTRDPARAEDIVQETLLKAFRFWHRYERGTNCKAWLFRILTNTFINRSRRKTPVIDSLDASERECSGVALAEQSAYYEGPEATYFASLYPEDVRAAVEGLPELFRVPVVLADLQDFSYKEIADIMGCPVGTVMSRLFRGRKRLQEVLFGRAIELGVIPRAEALDATGALSLDAWRARRKALES